jgi:amino acid transporter/mannitol/fructose-specific phosphotransferase system IIA component (Ntr-type)
VYAIATGATLSSGFFLLPGLAAAGAGAAMPLSYFLAALVLVPGLLCMAELATAMPRAGGLYYFLDRSMGPLVGTIGGFGTWIALILKSAFALVGVGAYLHLFLPELDLPPIAAAFAIFFGLVNLFSAKGSGSFQVVLLIGLLALLLWFCGDGVLHMHTEYLQGAFSANSIDLVGTAGLVVVSYMGLTKVASVSEEVINPERNLPLGMFLAFGTVVVIYVAGTSVMVGVAGVERLAQDGGDLAPVATVAEILVGHWGAVLMTVAAVLAFSSVANAGILSASRYPLAMGRDRTLPDIFGRVGSLGTPAVAIGATVVLILISVTVFDPTKIAKLASAFQLVMFALACVAVIVMRESGIESYDPGYRSPLYPAAHILGVLAPFWLIVDMGLLPTFFTAVLVTFGAMWFTHYAKDRVSREGAILHVFERLGRQRDEGLDRELREIMKERGPREADHLDEVVTGARVIDTDVPLSFEDLAKRVAEQLALDLPITADRLADGFLEGTRLGVTPVSRGAALPHIRLEEVERSHMVLVRARHGMVISGEGAEPIHALFFLVSPESDPGLHLRILAHLASRIDQEGFMAEWLAADNDEHLKETLIREECLLVLRLEQPGRTESLIGRQLRELSLPEGTLVAMIRRAGELVIPGGSTTLEEHDRLTIIGRQEGISRLRDTYGEPTPGREVEAGA